MGGFHIRSGPFKHPAMLARLSEKSRGQETVVCLDLADARALGTRRHTPRERSVNEVAVRSPGSPGCVGARGCVADSRRRAVASRSATMCLTRHDGLSWCSMEGDGGPLVGRTARRRGNPQVAGNLRSKSVATHKPASPAP